MNKNCVKSRFFKLIASYGVLEEFTSVLDQLWAVFYYLPILTTTKWTMDLGQQQNGTKLAYISNGVDKQQKLPKRGPKNTCMVPQKIISMKQLKILEKSDHRVFYFHAVTCEMISCFLYSLSLVIVKAFSLTLGCSDH